MYLLSFLSGVFVINGLPHFIKGITGEKHMTPFGRPSSAAVNVAWGWFNFLIGVICIYFAHAQHHYLRALALFMVGGLIVAINLAHFWTEHPNYNKK